MSWLTLPDSLGGQLGQIGGAPHLGNKNMLTAGPSAAHTGTLGGAPI